jgi:hypothetical protein
MTDEAGKELILFPSFPTRETVRALHELSIEKGIFSYALSQVCYDAVAQYKQ